MYPRSNPIGAFALGTSIAALLATACQTAYAATISKADNTNNLNLPSSWTGGGVPGAADIASWDLTVTGANGTVLGADLQWRGLEVADPGGPVAIGAGNTLTLGSGGIDLGAASQNLSIGSGLVLAAGGQEWDVALDRTLTLHTGAFTRQAGAVLNLPGEGTVEVSMTGIDNTYGILGPWATAGWSGNTRYAELSSGILTGFAGGTAAAAFGWPSGNDNTFNYDVGGVQGNLGVSRQANTARYTGGAGTQNWGNNNTTTITLNGLMNAGFGTLTFAEAGGTSQGQLVIGANNGNELVLDAASAGITVAIPIINGPGGAGSLVAAGQDAHAVTINSAGGASTYSGSTTVASGTLHLSGAGDINSSSGILVSGNGAKYLHTSSVPSTVPIALNSGTLDGTGSVGAVTVGNGTGAVITHGNGGSAPLTVDSLSFGGAADVHLTLSGGLAPLAVTGGLVTTPASGQVAIRVQPGGPLANGLYDLVSFGSFTGAVSDFTIDVLSGLNSRQHAALVADGNRFALQVSGDSPRWTGALNGNWTVDPVANPKNWSLITAGTPTDFLSGDHVLFDDAATGTTTVTLVSDIEAGLIEFANNAKPYTLTADFYAIVEGTIIKNGGGSLTIDSDNYHDGGLTFNAGTLNLNNEGALGFGPVVIGGGPSKTLGNTSGSEIRSTRNNPVALNDDLVFAGPDDLDLGSGTVTAGGDGGERAITVNGNLTLTIGELKAAAHDFVKQGAGTLALASSGAGAAASTVAGTLEVAAGTLQINRTGAEGAATGDLTVGGLTGTGTITNGGGTAESPTQRWLIVETTGDHTFEGILTDGGPGPLGLAKRGAGSLTLTGAHDYSGTTSIGAANGAGILRAAASGALGTGTIVFDGSGGTPGPTSRLELANGIELANPAITLSQRNNTSAAILNVDGENTLSGDIGLNAGGSQALIQSDAGKLTLSGAISAATANARNLHLGGAGDGEISGVVSNNPGNPAGVLNLTKLGDGTWTLSGARTHTGTTAINGGTLVITGDSTAATGTVTVANGARLDLTGAGNLGGGVTIAGGGRLALPVAATPGDQIPRQFGGVLDLSAIGDILELSAATPPALGVYTLVTANGGITGRSGSNLIDTVVTLNLGSGLTGTVSVNGDNLVLTVVEAEETPYESWAASFGLDPDGDGAPGEDKDLDGLDNGLEYILGGHPVDGADNPKVYSFIADTDDLKELILTIAVPQSAPAFPQGAPSSVVFEDFVIDVRGSTDLIGFNETVTPVATILPAGVTGNTFVQGGVTYEYRSFSLDGSNGTPGKGFLQVVVTNP